MANDDIIHGDTAALLAQLEAAVQREDGDPFGNPVLTTALQLSRRLDEGRLDMTQLAQLIRTLRDLAFDRRAARLAAYVGLGQQDGDVAATLARLAAAQARPDPEDSPVPFAQFRRGVERTRFAAVFTAHPTFALRPEVYAALASRASGDAVPDRFDSHRPAAPTLEQEFGWASEAIVRGRNALDRLNAALLHEAAAYWPQNWASLKPCPLTLATWVGYDTDGRTDIGWSDTLRLRLRMKRMQLERLEGQLRDAATPDGAAGALARLLERIGTAIETVARQIEACPQDGAPEPTAQFARLLVGTRDAALLSPAALDEDFAAAVAEAPEAARMALVVARAGLHAHGMSLAHTHVRLNATQLHNVARQRLGIEDSPEHPAQRRALLGAINEHLDDVQQVAVDFGDMIAEQASAARLMMTVAQIVKHVDGASPVRFLIAETETGYTLLTALWLARLLGIEQHVEISPLFETADALERGAQVVEEALRSRHWRDYLRRTGKMSLQFGYSDSGRYVGQLAATYLIERLRLKIADLLHKRGLGDVEVILFDTHGESIGRGAHPTSLADRLDYLSPPRSRERFAAAGVQIGEESAFQGGDGYLLFGTQALADATVAAIARHAFAASKADRDPIYDEPDFSADFFAAIGSEMRLLVDDPGYAAVLGAFGPALIDRTGSRPAARQSDASGAASRIRHPRELRAIPNNAILQQLGWCANTLQGIGAAAARHPETFDSFLDNSPRFRRALDFAAHALRHSNPDVLRAIVVTLDPGVWLDRAAHEHDPARREALVALSRGLERFDLWAITRSMFRRIQTDHLALRAAWPDAPSMAPEETVLHAIRLALIERLWLLSTRIPYFSPRHGFTREALDSMILRLDVPAALKMLAEIFPLAASRSPDLDFGEPGGPQNGAAYGREHAEIFGPMQQLFDLIREVSVAVMHEVGAFG